MTLSRTNTHSDSQDLSAIVLGAVESLNQAKALVENLSDEQFVKVCTPYVTSAIGSHLRHVLDMYYALRIGLDAQQGVIDYDLRRRGAKLESSRAATLADISAHLQWLDVAFFDQASGKLNASIFETPVSVKTEVCLSHTACATIPSNLAREIIFVASHAVHHFAILTVIAKLQGIEISNDFGVAPATRTFLREDIPASADLCAP